MRRITEKEVRNKGPSRGRTGRIRRIRKGPLRNPWIQQIAMAKRTDPTLSVIREWGDRPCRDEIRD